MGNRWLNKFGLVIIGTSLTLTTGCTPQEKEAASQAKVQKEEEKAQKQANKDAEKQRKQQEKDAKEESKQKEKEEKKKQAVIEKEVSEAKGAIRKILMTTDKSIADLKKSSINNGKLSDSDTKMLSGDLKLVLEHVGDIKDAKGETEAIKNYEAKLNDYIQSFEKGEERDVKELIRDIKIL